MDSEEMLTVARRYLDDCLASSEEWDAHCEHAARAYASALLGAGYSAASAIDELADVGVPEEFAAEALQAVGASPDQEGLPATPASWPAAGWGWHLVRAAGALVYVALGLVLVNEALLQLTFGGKDGMVLAGAGLVCAGVGLLLVWLARKRFPPGTGRVGRMELLLWVLLACGAVVWVRGMRATGLGGGGTLGIYVAIVSLGVLLFRARAGVRVYVMASAAILLSLAGSFASRVAVDASIQRRAKTLAPLIARLEPLRQYWPAEPATQPAPKAAGVHSLDGGLAVLEVVDEFGGEPPCLLPARMEVLLPPDVLADRPEDVRAVAVLGLAQEHTVKGGANGKERKEQRRDVIVLSWPRNVMVARTTLSVPVEAYGSAREEKCAEKMAPLLMGFLHTAPGLTGDAHATTRSANPQTKPSLDHR